MKFTKKIRGHPFGRSWRLKLAAQASAVISIVLIAIPAIQIIVAEVCWRFGLRIIRYRSEPSAFTMLGCVALMALAKFLERESQKIAAFERNERKLERFYYYMKEYPVSRNLKRPRARQTIKVHLKLEELEGERTQIGRQIAELNEGGRLSDDAAIEAFEQAATEAKLLIPRYEEADRRAKEFYRLAEYFKFIEIPRKITPLM